MKGFSFHIEAEKPHHEGQIERLTHDSFGGDERKKRTVYQFREGRPPLKNMGFVAVGDGGDKEGILVGTVRFWPLILSTTPSQGHAAPITLPLLGPLAVEAHMRGSGVGRALIRSGVAAIEKAGYPALFIIGDPGYYVPLGFDPEIVKDITLPGPVAPLTFMAKEFEAGFLCKHKATLKPVNIE